MFQLVCICLDRRIYIPVYYLILQYIDIMVFTIDILSFSVDRFLLKIQTKTSTSSENTDVEVRRYIKRSM